MEVKREYKNFDFSICEKIINDEESETGKIRLVLENKFKSIAYKAQLDNYKKKVDDLNEEADKAQCKVELKLKDSILQSLRIGKETQNFQRQSISYSH